MDNILEVNGLVKRYPAFSLDNVSFSLPEGCVTGFIGANGAGKTGIIASVRILKRLLLEQNYLSNTVVQNELHELINRKTGELEIHAEFLISTFYATYLFKYGVKLVKNNSDQFEIKHESLARQKVLSHVSLSEACFETNQGNLLVNCDDEYSQKLADMTKNLLSSASITSIVLNKEELFNPECAKNSEMWMNVISLALFGKNLFVCTDHGDDHS
jgi:predicted ATPase